MSCSWGELEGQHVNIDEDIAFVCCCGVQQAGVLLSQFDYDATMQMLM
jgi:hypothetical protein